MESDYQRAARDNEWWLYCLNCKALIVGPMAQQTVVWSLQVEEGIYACPLCHKGRVDYTTEGLSWPVAISEWMPWSRNADGEVTTEEPSFVNCMRAVNKDWTMDDPCYVANYDCFVDGHACGEPGWVIVSDENGHNGYKAVKE